MYSSFICFLFLDEDTPLYLTEDMVIIEQLNSFLSADNFANKAKSEYIW